MWVAATEHYTLVLSVFLLLLSFLYLCGVWHTPSHSADRRLRQANNWQCSRCLPFPYMRAFAIVFACKTTNGRMAFDSMPTCHSEQQQRWQRQQRQLPPSICSLHQAKLTGLAIAATSIDRTLRPGRWSIACLTASSSDRSKDNNNNNNKSATNAAKIERPRKSHTHTLASFCCCCYPRDDSTSV